jgi:hypothetical protein
MKKYHVSHWGNSDVPCHILKIETGLPHGSGINGDWHFEESQRMIRAFNTYSAMDEFGGYCHEYRFVVDIPKIKRTIRPDKFRVRLLARKHQCCGVDLWTYLDDTLCTALYS